MEDIFEITLLFDFYGSLLTDKQRDIVDMYYNLDFSLQEIADELNISRQTVFDTIKRSKVNLFSFEEKLQLIKRHQNIKDCVNIALNDIDEVLSSLDSDCSSYEKLVETKKMLQNID